jgi:hypothetical protein
MNKFVVRFNDRSLVLDTLPLARSAIHQIAQRLAPAQAALISHTLQNCSERTLPYTIACEQFSVSVYVSQP